jgi:hypothetical protein
MRILGMNVGGSESEKESFSEYWRRTAERRGGEIGLTTFATFLGRSSDKIRELPGLLYTVGTAVWFEDFERDNWLLSLMGSKRRFEKTEICFTKEEVGFTRVVSRGVAFRSIRGARDLRNTPPIHPLARIFVTPALQIGCIEGHSLFFEVMRQKELIDFLK